MMFYLSDSDGNVTGPHMAGVLMRKLNAGEISWEDLVCVQGTEDWVPAHVYQDEIDARGREIRMREERDRQYRALLLQGPAGNAGGGTAASGGAWLATCAFFIAGLAINLLAVIQRAPLLLLMSWVPAMGCLICGIVLCCQNRIGKGLAAIVFAVLLAPVIVWVRF